MINKGNKALIYALILLVFYGCAGVNKSDQATSQSHYKVDASYDEVSKLDTTFLNLVDTYKKQLDGEMNTIVSVASEALVSGKPESTLSNFLADAMLNIGREYCKKQGLTHSVDISLMNMGGIRTALPKGEVSTGRVYEMLPFKNKLVIIGMKGSDLNQLLQQVAYYGGEGVSGMKMGIQNRKAVDILVNNEPIEASKIYHVISIDYLVNGGGGFTAFENRETLRHLHKKLRSEIINYMTELHKEGVQLTSKKDGRIYNVE